MAGFFQGEQTLTLTGVQLSGGDHNGKLKKIKMKLSLAMDPETLATCPDWASEAYAYVAKSRDIIRPAHEFEAINLTFSADQLFGHRVVQGSAVGMKGFEIFKDGEEDGDILVTFTAEVSFSDAMWRWLGAMQGKDFYAKFEQVVEAEKPATEAQAQLNLTVN